MPERHPEYHIEYLNRNEYVASTASILDTKSISFAQMSLKWWDERFGWYEKGCVVLSDSEKSHLSYLFFKIDRYNNYITIHNIFTPQISKRKGYAELLLRLIFDIAVAQKVKRFRLTCISSSLDFYLSLGFAYWGVNSVGDYYCDLPLPLSGLDGVDSMVKELSTLELIGKSLTIISEKTQEYSANLSESRAIKYKSDVFKLNKSYLQESFLAIKRAHI